VISRIARVAVFAWKWAWFPLVALAALALFVLLVIAHGPAVAKFVLDGARR
jgi:hypothetical protein